ncbi:FG-GAP-like repeat-containing protein [Paenibacillus sp. HJGM_3]|uniref:FG-GAP-like repeat-containing protein n=1 Tax=Paenibacillus sp. HJGM_3 TaxID=3379816 RepID=UPI00385C3847
MNLKFSIKLIKLAPVMLAALLAVAPLHSFAADPPHYQSTSTVYSIGAGSIYDMEFSDIDGDGNLDMIALENTNNRVAILRGNGDGTFMAPQLLGVGSNPRSATVGDFNRDGINDIAVGNYNGSDVSILLGNADGTYQAAVSFLSGPGSLDVVTADLNEDGNLDLAVTNDSAGQISILYGNGDGTFGARVTHNVGSAPRKIVSGDFNRDGHIDLICTNDGSHSISVLLGNGHGVFGRQDYPAGNSPFIIVAGDWNHDAVTDLAVDANGDHGAMVLIGNGDGSFRAPVPYLTGSTVSPTYPLYISAGDFNGDGESDLVVMNQSVGYYSIFLGNADGTFQQPDLQYSPAGANPIKAGDFNGDGISDLVFGRSTHIDIMNSKSEGTIAFDASSYSVPENAVPASARVKIVRSDSYGPTTVRLTTTDGTAVSGTDYTAVTTTISFPAGVSFKTFDIPTVNNAVYSGDRAFTVTLSSPTNGVTLGAQASSAVTILEDEPAPDTSAPTVDATKFSAIDNYTGTPDQLIGSAGAVDEPGANVRAYAWNDTNANSTIEAGELSSTAIALGASGADGSLSAADLGDLPPGVYRYVITATDATGNESPRIASAAVTFTLTKASIPKPVISLIGANPLIVPVGSAFTDPGATAQDDNYGDLTASITVTGSVYTHTPGDYTLRYKVQNPAGVWADDVIRVVKVISESSGETGNSETAENPSSPGTSNIDQVKIKINGVIKLVNASYETTNGQRVTRVRLTSEQLAEAFRSKPDSILIEAQDIGQAVTADLPAALLLNAWKRQPDAWAELFVNGNGIRIPLSVLKDVPEDAALTATIALGSDSDSAAVNDAIIKRGGTPLLANPVVYSLHTTGERIIDWGGNSATRTVKLPNPADSDKATAVRVDESERLHFAPSVFSSDPSPKVTIRSPYDGVYTIIQLDRSFADLSGHWAQADIVLMANKLLVEGRTQDGFWPDDNITRAEFATLLVRALGLTEEDDPIPFRDDAAGTWYAGAVRAAHQAGLIDGFEDGTFRPLEHITREQMAVMIARAMKYAGYSLVAHASPRTIFADEADIANWAAAAVEQLTQTSIIQGITDTKFGPREHASRAQSAVMLKRMLQALGFINP